MLMVERALTSVTQIDGRRKVGVATYGSRWRRLPGPKSTLLGDAAAFLIGLSSLIEFPLIGRLFAPDVIFFLTFLVLLPRRGKKLLGVWPGRLLLLASIWLASQIATDLIRNSPPEDYLRGWAKIAFLIVNFAAIYMFLRNDRRILLYIVGYSLAVIVQYYVNPPSIQVADEDPNNAWKWVFGSPITFILVVAANVAYDRGRRRTAYCVIALAALLNFAFNFRSMALISFVTLAFLLLSQDKARRLRPLKLCMMLASVLAGCWGFVRCYEYAAASGALGYEALQKHELQSAGDMGVLLGGRNESFASFQAISDSPFIGHGSWAKDAYYIELLKSTAYEHGYRTPFTRLDLIPTHSHILGAWVEAGFLGTLFWFAAIILTIKGIGSLLTYPLPLRVSGLFFGSLLLWDIPFSPFAQERRFTTPALLLLMILATKRGRCYSKAGQSS